MAAYAGQHSCGMNYMRCLNSAAAVVMRSRWLARSRAVTSPSIRRRSSIKSSEQHQQDGLVPSASDPGPGPGSEAVAALGLEGSAWAHKQQVLEPGLYLVATPIGNLQDITLRALNILRSVSLVLAEDTRHTGKLLSAYGIRTSLASCHEHNERGRSRQVMARLQAGEAMALVSDAGMPGISDPGYVLVQQAVEAGVRVTPVPGACALIAAVVASGLPTDSFTFCGFLPPKQGARRSRLQSLRTLTSTLIFYAPPHGLRAVLEDMVAVLGGSRRVCVAREITKLHEEMFRASLAEALQEFTRREPRGEICLVVEGCDAATARYMELLAEKALQGAPIPSSGAPSAPEAAVAATDGRGSGQGGTAGAGQAPLGDGLTTTGVQQQEVESRARFASNGVARLEQSASRADASVSGSLLNLLQSGLAPGELAEQVLLSLLRSGWATKAAAKEAAHMVPSISKKEAYALALRLAEQAGTEQSRSV